MEGLIITIAIVGGIVALIVALVVLSARWEKQRTEGMQAVARELGFEFAAKHPGLHHQLESIPLFRVGHSQRSHNHMHGATSDVSVALFDYTYTTGSGKHKATFNQTVAVFEAPSLVLPEFVLRPEHFFDKLGQVVGYRDINFDDYPAFSKRFSLKGPDEDAIRRLFHVDLITFIEGMNSANIEGRGNRLVVYRANKRIKPDELQPFFEEAYKLFVLIRPAE